jgi:GT2 family glycosyltransferase
LSAGVSIVVPTRDRPAALARCLAALARLDPPAGGLEVIVVDNGATLQLGEPPAGLEVRSLIGAGTGPGAARNLGAEHAAGELLAFTDDDCEPQPGWLSALLPEVADGVAAGGRTVNLLADNPYSEASQHVQDLVYAHFNSDPRHARFVASNNLAMRRDDFLAAGGFDAVGFTYGAEDRDLCDRWRAAGNRLVYAPAAVVGHAHRLGLASYARQHFAYGRGAARFHAARAARGTGRLRDEMAFHGNLALWRASLALRPPRRAAQTIALLALWQAANAAGYAAERAASKRGVASRQPG